MRTGLLFRAGNYEDKNYSMTPGELRAAVEQFAPVPVDLEHTPTILSNKLGRVESVTLSEDGNSLMGTVALPEWLDGLIDEGQRRVSCTWDRATKTLSGLALVLNPRIDDAAVFAAFSAATATPDATVTIPADFAAPRHDTYHGQDALQGVHDMAARSGAVCSADNATTHPYPMFAAAHEVKAMQMIHDHAVSHGAKCSAMSPRKAAMSAAEEVPVQDEKRFMDHVKAFFTGEEIKPIVPIAAQPPITTPIMALKVEDSAEFKAAQAEIATLREERIASQAAAFADGEIAASRALPAEHAALLATFAQAAKDDAAIGGVVTFAAGTETKEGTRVDALVALCAARPAHTLTQPAPTGEARVIDNIITSAKFGGEQPMSEERKRELHMQTPEGRAFLDVQAKRAK